MFSVRYGLPAILVAAGFLCLLVAPESTRLEGWTGFTGAGALGAAAQRALPHWRLPDKERDTEQDQRDYFDEHGHWPDEKPVAGGRTRNLPEGVATLESEATDERRWRESGQS